MSPYGPKKDLIVRLESNSTEKVILCTGDTNATYKLSSISLEYDAIFDEPYATIKAKQRNNVDPVHQRNIDPLPDTV